MSDINFISFIENYKSTNKKVGFMSESVTNNYNSYHTFIILQEKAGILNPEFKKIISRQTRYNFRKRDTTKIIGIDLATTFDDNMDVFTEIFKSKTVIKLLKNAIRIKNTIISIADSFVKGKTKLFDVKKKVVLTIEKVKENIGFDRALKYFNLAKTKYYGWLKEVRNNCPISVIKKCFKKYPLQITFKEAKKMEKLLNDERFIYWPICSIAYYGLKEKIVSACLSTWYKYANIFGFKRKKAKSRRKDKKVGIRAEKPNKIIHVDLSEFRTNDGKKSYMYFITDNKSRRILSWEVSEEKRAAVTFKNIKKAYFEYIEPTLTKEELAQVYMDNGTENKKEVEDFINRKDISLKKILAIIDVDFSNSMAESINKIIKYNYLYKKNIPDSKTLKKEVDNAVNDYNNRPHYSLYGLTPIEVHTGKIPDYSIYKDQLLEAKKARIKENRNYHTDCVRKGDKNK